MGLIGGLLGQAGGSLVGNYLGGKTGAGAGQQIGGILGNLLPFEKGGMVKHTGPAKLHSGEMVVPKKYVKDVPKSLKKKIKKNGGHNM
jgi:hypothetical protein